MSFKLTAIPIVSVTTRDSTDMLNWKIPVGSTYPAPPTRDYFYFVPTEECEMLLAKYQMVYQPTKSGLNIFYNQREVNNVNMDIGLLNGVFKRFTFAIYLNDKDIGKRFPATVEPTALPSLYLNNLDLGTLDYGLDLSGLSIKKTDSNLCLSGGKLSSENYITFQPSIIGGKDTYERIGHGISPLPPDPDDERIVYNLSNKFSSSKPYGVLDIFLKDRQDTFALRNYFISLI
jgi:hypothetical protein